MVFLRIVLLRIFQPPGCPLRGRFMLGILNLVVGSTFQLFLFSVLFIIINFVVRGFTLTIFVSGFILGFKIRTGDLFFS